MIPASYLFKNIYDQTWEQEQHQPAPLPREPSGHSGLLTPIRAIAARLGALFDRPAHHAGAHW